MDLSITRDTETVGVQKPFLEKEDYQDYKALNLQ
jgi:hypothetical protein